MLAMSDIRIEQFFPIFANAGVPVAFLVPTPTGYGKSIMDATSSVRILLKNANLHDYEAQEQGPGAKVLIESYFVYPDKLFETTASLYRPLTKKGDPRIWFSNLRHYCQPCNLLALVVIDHKIFVINLSNQQIRDSLFHRDYVYALLYDAGHQENAIANELRIKIQEIHNRGFLPSVTPGDPGVGDTLENALGIQRNNSRNPDYKGIELKATRLTRDGVVRNPTRVTLFTKVPDEGMTYRQIVDNYGKVQTPRNSMNARLQLYETLRASRANAYDLLLEVDNNRDKLNLVHANRMNKQFVSAWQMQTLREALLVKHHETFWVKALSEIRNGIEYFRYDKILHTKNPNVSLIAPLLESDVITVDLAAHYNPDGRWRDHGVLFKMMQDKLPMILCEPTEYDLTAEDETGNDLTTEDKTDYDLNAEDETN